MKVLYKLLSFCLCIIPMQLCFASTIVVDINGTGNFTTIQAAIDNAVHGDTVLVLPGTYFENINYNGKNICVMSKFGPDTTIIDGSQPQDFTYRSVVTFNSGEDTTAVLSGFTITGGIGMYYQSGNFNCRMGGGIICGSSPVIENNIIRDNITDSGGGIEIGADDRSPSPIIRNNIFWRNKGHEYDPTWVYGAGAINVWATANPIIINNTIVNNEGTDMCGGVLVAYTDELLLYNNIIVNNVGGGIWDRNGTGNAKAFYNNIWNNIPNQFGNPDGISGVITIVGGISMDPMFVDPENGDFRLQPGSPCIDAGDPYSPLDPDGTRTDIGAKFYYHLDAPYVWKTEEKIDDSNGNNNGRPDAGETAQISITLINTSLDATGVTATLVSDDPGIQIVQETATFGNMVRNQVANNENNPFEISVEPGIDAHFTKFYINITADGNYANTDSMTIMVGSPPFLIVDDDNEAEYENFFIQPLNATNIYPEHWDISTKGTPARDLMLQYRAVVWFTGDDGETALTAEEQTAIADYLDNGGKLLITGQNLGDDLVKNGSASDSVFYANYLHAQLVADSTQPTVILGVSGDPITNGILLSFSGSFGGARNQSTPDIIAANSDAKIILKYSPGMGGAALCYEDPITDSRLVYLAFGFEGIAGPQDISAMRLMTNVLTWLQGTTAVDQIIHSELPQDFDLKQNYPNPFNPTTTINYAVAKNSHVKLTVYNMLGQVVAVLVDGIKSQGFYEVNWNAHSQPSGLYFYRLEADGFTATKKMLLQK